MFFFVVVCCNCMGTAERPPAEHGHWDPHCPISPRCLSFGEFHWLPVPPTLWSPLNPLCPCQGLWMFSPTSSGKGRPAGAETVLLFCPQISHPSWLRASSQLLTRVWPQAVLVQRPVADPPYCSHVALSRPSAPSSLAPRVYGWGSAPFPAALILPFAEGLPSRFVLF